MANAKLKKAQKLVEQKPHLQRVYDQASTETRNCSPSINLHGDLKRIVSFVRGLEDNIHCNWGGMGMDEVLTPDMVAKLRNIQKAVDDAGIPEILEVLNLYWVVSTETREARKAGTTV